MVIATNFSTFGSGSAYEKAAWKNTPVIASPDRIGAGRLEAAEPPMRLTDGGTPTS